jgi:hypothetical protein
MPRRTRVGRASDSRPPDRRALKSVGPTRESHILNGSFVKEMCKKMIPNTSQTKIITNNLNIKHF